jgi:hypothetical protein
MVVAGQPQPGVLKAADVGLMRERGMDPGKYRKAGARQGAAIR